MTLEERYPVIKVVEKCPRCGRRHEIRAAGYWRAKAREKLSSWLTDEIDKKIEQSKGNAP